MSSNTEVKRWAYVMLEGQTNGDYGSRLVITPKKVTLDRKWAERWLHSSNCPFTVREIQRVPRV